MSNRTLLLIGLLLIIATSLVLVALNSPYSPTVAPSPIAPPPVTLPVEESVLRFDDPVIATESAASNTANVTYSLPLIINTGRNAVTAVQVELAFDPKVLAKVSVNPGSFFNNPIVLLNEVDESTGKISYALGISPQDNGIRGEGVVAMISFQTKVASPTATSVTFLPKTMVTAEGVSQSVLKSATPAQFIVGQ